MFSWEVAKKFEYKLLYWGFFDPLGSSERWLTFFGFSLVVTVKLFILNHKGFPGILIDIIDMWTKLKHFSNGLSDMTVLHFAHN